MITSILITATLALAALAAASVKRIPEGQVYSLRRLGKPAGLLTAGTHVVMPLIERIVHKINLGGQALRFEDRVDSAHDVRGTVYWQVLEPERADAVIDHADELIRERVLHALHDARSNAETADRRAVGAQLKQLMNGVLRDSGMLVTRVELDAA
jgi:regulator of protease activity HflC (stomatin/prohibitin superfamily)